MNQNDQIREVKNLIKKQMQELRGLKKYLNTLSTDSNVDMVLMQETMIDVIEEFYAMNPAYIAKTYNLNVDVVKAGLMPLTFFTRRLSSRSYFKKANGGASKAIKTTIGNLLRDGKLVEVSTQHIKENYGYGGRCFYSFAHKPELEVEAQQKKDRPEMGLSFALVQSSPRAIDVMRELAIESPVEPVPDDDKYPLMCMLVGQSFKISIDHAQQELKKRIDSIDDRRFEIFNHENCYEVARVG